MCVNSPFLYALWLASAAVDPSHLTDAQKERFLRTARIVGMKPLSTGITHPWRVTLSDSGITHDAHAQTVDVYKDEYDTGNGIEKNFRDSYKFNIAAYKLDRLLRLNMSPPCVEREVEGKPGALCWWIDGLWGSELDRITKNVRPPDVDKWNRQNYAVRVFDQLIYNTDRNRGNLLIDKSWNVWMIDHTRAFRVQHTLMDESRLQECAPGLLERLRRLSLAQLKSELGQWLTDAQITALLARRDAIVRHYGGSQSRASDRY